MPNLETAKEAQRLYAELSILDGKLGAMLAKQMYAKTPLQKVTFYRCSSTFSGPDDYRPQHCEEAIAACIVTDMRIERSLLVTRIHSLGFETPEAPANAEIG